ncbi:BatD family protein [Echinicola marina]|uniref:hypothetical protein n=1 Tax=Echinicola marina TaxID=2859768 RepID=UPI001CF6727F|nr:hypothetical protein [Echinicola marina]UCS92072.1 BatD family protein [Echinicola marina]
MKRLIKYILIVYGICLGLLLSLPSKGQQVWAEVHLNQSTVYVGQPVTVGIKVYTSTWFTRGIDLGNLQVNGAFTTYFRPVSGSISKNGMTYSNVELIYHVFPYKEENIVFPSLDISVETPPEGDYKGVKMELQTEQKLIKVKPVPPGFETNDWLVAGGLTVDGSWSGSLNDVKVGDVLERKIVRTASGTMSRLIPPINWDTVPGLGLYPDRTSLNDNKGKTSISASRTEAMKYLFEKEGEITIPEMVFHWYNPYQDKLYKRTLKSVKIEVKANPNMGILTTIKDSLASQEAQLLMDTVEKKPFTWLGFSWKQLLILCVILFVLVFFVVKITRNLINWNRTRQQAYLHSERYYWDLFLHAAKKNQSKETLKSIYRWIDELDLKEPSLKYFIKNYGTSQLKEKLATSNGKIEIAFFSHHLNDFKLSRKRYLQGKGKVFRPSRSWVNP